MKAEQWQEAMRILRRLDGAPPEAQESLLSSSALDPDVLRIVRTTLEQSNAWTQAPPSERTGPPRLLVAGQRIGRYVLEASIGRGGMGEVWSARDEELARTVALKILTSQDSRNAPLREAKAASSLNHPNIVTIHETVSEHDACIIVMEWVDGIPLRSLVGLPVPPARVAGLGRQIAEALGAAHAAGVVHGDIKPENVMVRADGYLKVVDFGLARWTATDGEPWAAGLPVGTMRYMSPEQVRGETLTSASDVFSLGLVLYELATGRHAFPAASPIEAAYAITSVEPQPPSSGQPQIPRKFDSLVLSMLRKEPGARPAAREVAQQLASIASPTMPTPSRRAVWPYVAAVGVVAAFGTGWLISRNSSAGSLIDFKVTPLTAQSGWERSPALSPDGQAVAFAWSASRDEPAGIYVKRANDDAPRLWAAPQPGRDVGSLVWSPDGTQLAFKRKNGRVGGGVHILTAPGGAERKLLTLRDADFSSALDWSPDGQLLAFTDLQPVEVGRLVEAFLYRFSTGQTRKLTSPPVGIWGDWDPKFSPDGSTIAFKRVQTFLDDDLFTIPAAGGEPRAMTSDRRSIAGHAWMPDGRSLIASWQRGGLVFSLWRVPVQRGALPERITFDQADSLAPTVSRAGDVAWVSQLEDADIYRTPLDRVGATERLIASTARDHGASYSPDGRIALMSDRTGNREVWIANADGTNQVRATDLGVASVGPPRWSRDGRHLAFNSQKFGSYDVFVLDCEVAPVRCGQPKRLTSASSDEVAPTWSADGRFLYFASNRTGNWDVWRVPSSGGEWERMTRNGGFLAFASDDGRQLHYSTSGTPGIWRISLSSSGADPPSGPPELIVGAPRLLNSSSWALQGDKIVFAEPARQAGVIAIQVLQLPGRREHTAAEVPDMAPESGLSVSPDARWVLYEKYHRLGSNILVSAPAR